MSITQNDIQAIKQAIRHLSRIEREDLAEWILDASGFDLRVEETALAYGGPRRLTVEEYLELDDEDGVRYEYVAGQIFAMSSPLIRHEVIVANLLVHFQNQLRGGPCRAWVSNAKVRLQVNREDIFYIPDVMVACSPLTDKVLDGRYLTDPCVVVEVLSASTEAIDRREKALNYRYLPSLEEYLLVAQRSVEVTVFRRSEGWSPWVLTAPEDVFESRAVEVKVALADIYEGARG
jgi:Uma2 family endonuclease